MAVVLLEVIMECRNCKGSGKVGMLWWKKTCDWCDGTGQAVALNQLKPTSDPSKKKEG